MPFHASEIYWFRPVTVPFKRLTIRPGTLGGPFVQYVPTLILISPHNENIQQEFGDAFATWHEAEFGSPVEMEWRDVGGGTSAIVQYLRNVYSRSDSAEIDILWGGGEQPFTALAGEGVFTPIVLPEGSDTLEQIPEQFSGM